MYIPLVLKVCCPRKILKNKSTMLHSKACCRSGTEPHIYISLVIKRLDRRFFGPFQPSYSVHLYHFVSNLDEISSESPLLPNLSFSSNSSTFGGSSCWVILFTCFILSTTLEKYRGTATWRPENSINI